MKIHNKYNENIDRFLKKFKKFVLREGIIQECKKHMFYEKPGDLKRRKDKQNKKNWLKAQSMRQHGADCWIKE